MRAFVPLALMVLAGCKSAAERCTDISIQSLRNRVYEHNEEDFQKRLYNQGSYLAAPDTMQERLRREVRYAMALELRQLLSDSTRRFLPPPDSTDPKPEPPPKPSELTWAAEHCYQGTAR